MTSKGSVRYRLSSTIHIAYDYLQLWGKMLLVRSHKREFLMQNFRQSPGKNVYFQVKLYTLSYRRERGHPNQNPTQDLCSAPQNPPRA